MVKNNNFNTLTAANSLHIKTPENPRMCSAVKVCLLGLITLKKWRELGLRLVYTGYVARALFTFVIVASCVDACGTIPYIQIHAHALRSLWALTLISLIKGRKPLLLFKHYKNKILLRKYL